MPAQHGCSWVHAYLCAYNTILALGWFAVACVVCARLSARADVLASMRTALRAAYFLQALSALETLHALLKLVNSGVLFNILQWLGRAHALYLVVGPEAHLHASPAAATMLAAWGVGEACRYPWCVSEAVCTRPGRRLSRPLEPCEFLEGLRASTERGRVTQRPHGASFSRLFVTQNRSAITSGAASTFKARRVGRCVFASAVFVRFAVRVNVSGRRPLPTFRGWQIAQSPLAVTLHLER